MARVNEKIVFWLYELGSNLVQGNPKVGVRRGLAFTSKPDKKSYNSYRGNNFHNRNESNNEGNASCSEKSGSLCCEERKHVSVFNCEGFKHASMTARCRFVVSHHLCWLCLEWGHIAGRCPDKRIKVCDKYFHCEIACPYNYWAKKFISSPVLPNRTLHGACGEKKWYIYL